MYLYQWDLLASRGLRPEHDPAAFCQWQDKDEQAGHFATRLIEGVITHRDELDAAIDAAAHNWALERMSVIDRTVLRLALFELHHCPDIPEKVSLNEAIELAKRFSTKRSSAFVNGILDRVRAESARRDATASGSQDTSVKGT